MPLPVLRGAAAAAETVEQFGYFELRVDVEVFWKNPHDYDEVCVEATFHAPDGSLQRVEGFFMQGFEVADPASGVLAQAGEDGFCLRFSPGQTGDWTYVVACTNRRGTVALPAQRFHCKKTVSPHNRGFVRTGPGHFFKFDNGEQYIPVGENMAWPQTNAYVDFSKWIDKLAAHGGNFIRVWNCHWGLGLEWREDGNYAGLKKYHQINSFYLDWLFDFCAAKGVYVMLCLHHHGQVSTRVNPNWNENPYNAVNGGPCRNTWDFFCNAKAKKMVQNRLRYMLARWGAQRSLLAWELFNEVDWTDQFRRRRRRIARWHAEMAAFLKKYDPYRHPVSTSFGRDELEPSIWNLPEIDFTQTHVYVDVHHPERALAEGVHRLLEAFDKPTLNAEFGLDPEGGELARRDPEGIYFHNCLWAPLFSGAAGTGMSWWWDHYVEPKDLYRHFTGVAAVAGKIALQARDLRPAEAVAPGHDLDAYVLTSADGRCAAGWLLHPLHHHVHVAARGRPAPVRGAGVQVDGLADGNYAIRWYECVGGELIHTDSVAISGGKMWLAVPELAWDLAFTADHLAGPVA